LTPFVRRLLLVSVVSVVAAGAGYWTAVHLRAPAAAPAGATDFSLPDLDGRPQTLAQWRGKTVLLNFWATWCPPCREEIPLFVEYQRQYAARGLQIVGIAIDSREAVSAFTRQLKTNYPQLLAQDTGLALMARYGNRAGSLPFSVVISPQGNVVSQKLGAYRRADLDAVISQIKL
jgi:thiol-disulfide isomerase/thioredoxin